MAEKKGDNRNGYFDQVLKNEALDLYRACMVIDELSTGETMDGLRIMEIKLQGPAKRGGGVLAVIKARDASGQDWVAFRSGPDVRSVMRTVGQQLADGSLRFKEERPLTPTRMAWAAQEGGEGE
jgi:hypothetical protein